MNAARVISVLGVVCLSAGPAGAWSTNDWQFLDTIERANLRFFQNEKTGPYNLLKDIANYDGSPFDVHISSVGGVGFELTAICLGHYRGWISHSNAYEQVLRQMRAFNNLLSADPEVFKRINGWTYHWYSTDTGYQDSPDGLSLLDHGLFIGGCIFVAEYFKGTEAADLANRLYEETTWSWRPDTDYNFGYSEDLLPILESAEAPQYKKGSGARDLWNSLLVPWPRRMPLYYWQYPHCWIDFRFRTDERGYNHTDIARDSILEMRNACINLRNGDPARYDMLGSNVWGQTAASSSTGYRQMVPWPIYLERYYDTEEACDSGSITPIALPPCMIFAGTETMAAMKYLYEQYYINGWDPAKGERPVWSDVYGFLNCFNQGRPWNYYSDPSKSNWFWGANAAIDYGPNVLMLENYKLGSAWRWFMQNPYIASGMNTLGFGAPQHVTFATFSNQVNQFGGGLGSWGNDGSPAVISYAALPTVNEFVRDYGVRITANNKREGGWVELARSDQRAQASLVFWFKAQTGQERIKVGLKDHFGKEQKVRLEDFAGGSTPTGWTKIEVPLERFCLTGVVTNDTWPGDLELACFEFTNSAGGTVDLDYLAFTKDTLAPRTPTNDFGVAQAGPHARVKWNPAGAEQDVVGYHVWRRYDGASGFTRVTTNVVPAYLGVWEDTSTVAAIGREARYAIQAFDNSEPVNFSAFAPEKRCTGGRLDIDWNNGKNPNVLGGSNDGFYGSATVHGFPFVYTNLPGGINGWVRRSYVNAGNSGHYVDMANADAGDYWALMFHVRGAGGGEHLRLGLRDSADRERILDLNYFLDGGAVGMGWTRALVPLSDFTNVNIGSLRNLSFTHEMASDVQIAGLGFVGGQRSLLTEDYFTEAEDYTRQLGSPSQDLKAAASGGEVLGQGWGLDSGDYADYEFYVVQPMSGTVAHIRYACDAGDGRTLDVRWDDQFVGGLACTNTHGWGDLSNHFSWATVSLPATTGGWHKLTFFANGVGAPVNLDGWYLTDVRRCARECEDYDAQVGSGGQDVKAGASGGEVLGQSWGVAANSEAVYSNVDAGVHTGAWFHLWCALNAAGGRVVDVYVDGARRAALVCPPTRGWGDRAGDFDRASAFIGELGGGTHTVRLAVPNGGQAINLDCFYVGAEGPDGFGVDSDGDGLSDRQERVTGTSTGSTDSDGDGLSDAGELQYGRYGQVSDPAKADTDADSLNDLQESIAGTDPANSNAFFQCLEIAAENFPILGKTVSWPSSSGRLYSIHACTNLLISDFWPLTSGLAATPPVNTWTDTVGGAGPAKFYRIDVRRGP